MFSPRNAQDENATGREKTPAYLRKESATAQGTLAAKRNGFVVTGKFAGARRNTVVARNAFDMVIS